MCIRDRVKDQSHSGRDSLEIPDMGNRSCKLNVSHTLSSDRRFCYFNAASVTDNALITDLFVFTAMTLPVLAWSKDPLAEKSVLFRFQSTVVNSLRLGYFAS